MSESKQCNQAQRGKYGSRKFGEDARIYRQNWSLVRLALIVYACTQSQQNVRMISQTFYTTLARQTVCLSFNQ